MSFLLKPIGFLFIMLLAFTLKRSGMFSKDLSATLLKILTNITIPAVAITAFTGIQRDLSLLWLTLVGLLAAAGCYFLMLLFTKKLGKKDRINYVISASGFNVGCYGMPLVQGFFGPATALYCIMFDIGNAIMVLGGNYAFTSSMFPMDGSKVTAKKVLSRFFKSFSMDVYLALLVMLILNIRIPQVVADFIAPISNANAFLAMFMLGLLITPPKNKSQWKSTLHIIVFRNAVLVAMAIVCFFTLPFSIEIRRIVILLLLCPIGATSPGFIQACGGDGESAAFTNSVNTISSLVIMTVLAGMW